jgi:cellulose synthase/poly-beta-1,6-N-acetylglucosamine synthase-like glycosyltransferase
MGRAMLEGSLTAVATGVLVYFLVLNTLYLVFAVMAAVELQRHRRRWTARDLDAVMRSPSTPGISLIVPTHNEEVTIVPSVRALLMLNYPQYEVIVVNDGSGDATLSVAAAAFDLVCTEVSRERPLATAEVRGLYRSLAHPELPWSTRRTAARPTPSTPASIAPVIRWCA